MQARRRIGGSKTPMELDSSMNSMILDGGTGGGGAPAKAFDSQAQLQGKSSKISITNIYKS